MDQMSQRMVKEQDLEARPAEMVSRPCCCIVEVSAPALFLDQELPASAHWLWACMSPGMQIRNATTHRHAGGAEGGLWRRPLTGVGLSWGQILRQGWESKCLIQ